MERWRIKKEKKIPTVLSKIICVGDLVYVLAIVQSQLSKYTNAHAHTHMHTLCHCKMSSGQMSSVSTRHWCNYWRDKEQEALR